MSPSVIVDSESSAITYVPKSSWSTVVDDSTYGGSYASPMISGSSTSGTSGPTMQLTFNGAGIHFYGQPTDAFRLNYTFEGSAAREVDLNITKGASGKTGNHLWGLDNLSDSRSHEMSLLPIAGQPVFDYAVVTPSSSTSLGGLTMVLDDTDSWITYKGSGWTSKSGMQSSAGLPYNGTQRGSSNPGDSLTVNFEGRSVAVYGLLNQLPGKLLTTYHIDDTGPTKFAAYDGSQTSEPDKWALHQSFFKTDLSAGKHTLIITVKEVTESQVFWIDYITFEATSATTLIQSGGFKDPKNSPLGFIIIAIFIVIFIAAFLLFPCYWPRTPPCCWPRISPCPWRRISSCHWRRPWEILFERMSGILAKLNALRGPVEVPTRPHMPRQPPHLTDPETDDMTLFELQSTAKTLREENQNLYNASSTPSTSYHSPPYPSRAAASHPSRDYLQTGYDPTPASSSDIIPLLAVTSSQGSVAEVAALRSEIERLRRENHQMQVTRNPRHSDAIDAGPADAPPAYNPANYIP